VDFNFECFYFSSIFLEIHFHCILQASICFICRWGWRSSDSSSQIICATLVCLCWKVKPTHWSFIAVFLDCLNGASYQVQTLSSGNVSKVVLALQNCLKIYWDVIGTVVERLCQESVSFGSPGKNKKRVVLGAYY
jgi:hypothetical protein